MWTVLTTPPAPAAAPTTERVGGLRSRRSTRPWRLAWRASWSSDRPMDAVFHGLCGVRCRVFW